MNIRRNDPIAKSFSRNNNILQTNNPEFLSNRIFDLDVVNTNGLMRYKLLTPIEKVQIAIS
jgi:hypothetical protein